MKTGLILFHYLWIAPHLLLIGVAVAMFRKGLHRVFPIFFVSLLFEFLQFSILYPMYIHVLRLPSMLYVPLDVGGRMGSTALHFGIMQELFASPVKYDASLHRTADRTLKWITAGLVLLALVFVGFQYYNGVEHRLLPPYVSIEALNIAQCFVLLLVFLWYRFLGRKMSTMEFGIVLGLGLVSSLEPLIQVWKDSPAGLSRVPDYLQMGVYHCSVLVWLGCALAYRKDAKGAAPPPYSGRNLLELNESAADMERIVRL
jgi:FtsH-binding integral membrane protein